MARPGSLEALLGRAAQLHQAGDLAQAIKAYRRVVERAPNHAAALNLLGLAYFQNGEAERAVPALERALAIDRTLPSGHYNLGTILQSLGRLDEALDHYQQALALRPDDAGAHNNLGTVLRALGRNADAIEHFSRAATLQPSYADAHFNLARALAAAGRSEEASAAFERAVTLDPQKPDWQIEWGRTLMALERYDDALARIELGLVHRAGDADVHVLRGNALHRLGRYAEAAASYRAALDINARHADAHLNLGAALNDLDRHEEAIECYRRALALRPGDINALLNLGNALQALRRFEEAIATYQDAARRNPARGDCHFNLGVAYEALDRHDEAIGAYESAIALLPDDVRAKWNKAHLALAVGRFAEGWPLYDERWAAHRLQPRCYPQPSWNGERVEGTLLVWAEQGLGDQILHASMIDDLRARAGSIRLAIEPRLVPLFARSFPGVEVVPLGTELDGTIAAQTSLLTLGRHLRPDWAAFARERPDYLRADPARAAALRARLSGDGRRVVGLSWQSANPRLARAKTARLAELEAVLQIPGCRFIDLQYGDTSAERAALAQDFGLTVERLEDIDNRDDLDGLAALISACDLVVTVSNTTAHLAGALGRPTWVLLPFGGARFWYWFRDRADSPWYPSVRIRRLKRDQDWSDLAVQVAGEIAGFAGA